MKPVSALEITGRTLHIGMAVHEGSVNVDRDPLRDPTKTPNHFAGNQPGILNHPEKLRIQAQLLDDPVDGRIRRHLPEQRLLARKAPRSIKASPPAANITARSLTTRPGSCVEARSRTPASPRERASVRPERPATPANNIVPELEIKPCPSGVTSTLKPLFLHFTLKVNSFRPEL